MVIAEDETFRFHRGNTVVRLRPCRYLYAVGTASKEGICTHFLIYFRFCEAVPTPSLCVQQRGGGIFAVNIRRHPSVGSVLPLAREIRAGVRSTPAATVVRGSKYLIPIRSFIYSPFFSSLDH